MLLCPSGVKLTPVVELTPAPPEQATSPSVASIVIRMNLSISELNLSQSASLVVELGGFGWNFCDCS